MISPLAGTVCFILEHRGFTRGFPDSSAGKESACNEGDDSWVGEIPWRRDRLLTPDFLGFPGGSDGKESTCNGGDSGFYPWVGKIPWRRAWQPTPVFLPGESPWTEEPGGLQSTGLQRVHHDWATKHTARTSVNKNFLNQLELFGDPETETTGSYWTASSGTTSQSSKRLSLSDYFNLFNLFI